MSILKRLRCAIFKHKVAHVRRFGVSFHKYRCVVCGRELVGCEGTRGLLDWDVSWDMEERGRNDITALTEEVERLRKLFTKHNLLPWFASQGHCECDPDTGMTPCMKHAAQDILDNITKDHK